MTKTFDIKIQGLDELVRDFKTAGKKLPDDIYKATTASATMVQNDAKKVAPDRFKNQTGTLRRSIQKKITRPASAIVFTDEKYAIFVESGTRPHVIRPKNKKFLAFKMNGRLVFAKKVFHRGSRPYPFFKPAFDNNITAIQNLFTQVIESSVRILRG